MKLLTALILFACSLSVQAFSLGNFVSRDRVTLNSTEIAGYRFPNILTSKIIVPANAFVFDYLKNAGSSAMNVNGSVTPVPFRFTVPPGVTFLPKDINFFILGNNNTIDRFGSIAGGLVNGITFKIFDAENNLLTDFSGGEPIKKNGDFFLLAAAAPEFVGAVAVSFNILTLGASISVPSGGYVEVLVRDNLTALTEFRVSVNGLYMPGDITFAQ